MPQCLNFCIQPNFHVVKDIYLGEKNLMVEFCSETYQSKFNQEWAKQEPHRHEYIGELTIFRYVRTKDVVKLFFIRDIRADYGIHGQ